MALVIAKLLRSEISEGYKAHMVIIVRGFQPVAACCSTTFFRYILPSCLPAEDSRFVYSSGYAHLSVDTRKLKIRLLTSP